MNLPNIRQIQIIADILTTGTLPANIDPAQLTQPWRQYYDWCRSWILLDPDDVDPHDLEHEFFQNFAPLSKEHAAHAPVLRRLPSARRARARSRQAARRPPPGLRARHGRLRSP